MSVFICFASPLLLMTEKSWPELATPEELPEVKTHRSRKQRERIKTHCAVVVGSHIHLHTSPIWKYDPRWTLYPERATENELEGSLETSGTQKRHFAHNLLHLRSCIQDVVDAVTIRLAARGKDPPDRESTSLKTHTHPEIHHNPQHKNRAFQRSRGLHQ